MKLQITSSAVTDLPTSAEWVFIQTATGDIDVTFVTDSGNKTVTIGQGEMIKMPFSGLQFQAREGDQEISFRIGYGEYTPNITAVTSTIIDQIKQPVAVSSISGTVNVKGITDAVAVSGIADPVAVSGIADPVAVSGITAPVAVSGITAPVAVSGITAPVAVSSIADPVAVSGLLGDEFSASDLVIPSNEYRDILARDRSQIVLQNMSETTTKCRISEITETSAGGLWLIGGGALFGESPTLRTKAALRVWNTSETDAQITVSEVY